MNLSDLLQHYIFHVYRFFIWQFSFHLLAGGEFRHSNRQRHKQVFDNNIGYQECPWERCNVLYQLAFECRPRWLRVDIIGVIKYSGSNDFRSGYVGWPVTIVPLSQGRERVSYARSRVCTYWLWKSFNAHSNYPAIKDKEFSYSLKEVTVYVFPSFRRKLRLPCSL